MHNFKPILLLEDDSVDAMTVRRAFKDLNVLNSLVRFINGEDAVDYLRNSANLKPCVILLDLNMPKMNGIEFLKVIKADENFKRIPAIVLTTSKDDQDRIQSYQLSVAGFIVKPVDYIKFVEAMKIIDLYWTLSELPNVEQENDNVALKTDFSSRV
jgi:CheY-like chemotaxis protein